MHSKSHPKLSKRRISSKSATTAVKPLKSPTSLTPPSPSQAHPPTPPLSRSKRRKSSKVTQNSSISPPNTASGRDCPDQSQPVTKVIHGLPHGLRKNLAKRCSPHNYQLLLHRLQSEQSSAPTHPQLQPSHRLFELPFNYVIPPPSGPPTEAIIGNEKKRQNRQDLSDLGLNYNNTKDTIYNHYLASTHVPTSSKYPNPAPVILNPLTPARRVQPNTGALTIPYETQLIFNHRLRKQQKLKQFLRNHPNFDPKSSEISNTSQSPTSSTSPPLSPTDHLADHSSNTQPSTDLDPTPKLSQKQQDKDTYFHQFAETHHLSPLVQHPNPFVKQGMALKKFVGLLHSVWGTHAALSADIHPTWADVLPSDPYEGSLRLFASLGYHHERNTLNLLKFCVIEKLIKAQQLHLRDNVVAIQPTTHTPQISPRVELDNDNKAIQSKKSELISIDLSPDGLEVQNEGSDLFFQIRNDTLRDFAGVELTVDIYEKIKQTHPHLKFLDKWDGFDAMDDGGKEGDKESPLKLDDIQGDLSDAAEFDTTNTDGAVIDSSEKKADQNAFDPDWENIPKDIVFQYGFTQTVQNLKSGSFLLFQGAVFGNDYHIQDQLKRAIEDELEPEFQATLGAGPIQQYELTRQKRTSEYDFLIWDLSRAYNVEPSASLLQISAKHAETDAGFNKFLNKHYNGHAGELLYPDMSLPRSSPLRAEQFETPMMDLDFDTDEANSNPSKSSSTSLHKHLYYHKPLSFLSDFDSDINDTTSPTHTFQTYMRSKFNTNSPQLTPSINPQFDTPTSTEVSNVGFGFYQQLRLDIEDIALSVPPPKKRHILQQHLNRNTPQDQVSQVIWNFYFDELAKPFAKSFLRPHSPLPESPSPSSPPSQPNSDIPFALQQPSPQPHSQPGEHIYNKSLRTTRTIHAAKQRELHLDSLETLDDLIADFRSQSISETLDLQRSFYLRGNSDFIVRMGHYVCPTTRAKVHLYDLWDSKLRRDVASKDAMQTLSYAVLLNNTLAEEHEESMKLWAEKRDGWVASGYNVDDFELPPSTARVTNVAIAHGSGKVSRIPVNASYTQLVARYSSVYQYFIKSFHPLNPPQTPGSAGLAPYHGKLINDIWQSGSLLSLASELRDSSIQQFIQAGYTTLPEVALALLHHLREDPSVQDDNGEFGRKRIEPEDPGLKELRKGVVYLPTITGQSERFQFVDKRGVDTSQIPLAVRHDITSQSTSLSADNAIINPFYYGASGNLVESDPEGKNGIVYSIPLTHFDHQITSKSALSHLHYEHNHANPMHLHHHPSTPIYKAHRTSPPLSSPPSPLSPHLPTPSKTTQLQLDVPGYTATTIDSLTQFVQTTKAHLTSLLESAGILSNQELTNGEHMLLPVFSADGQGLEKIDTIPSFKYTNSQHSPALHEDGTVRDVQPGVINNTYELHALLQSIVPDKATLQGIARLPRGPLTKLSSSVASQIILIHFKQQLQAIHQLVLHFCFTNPTFHTLLTKHLKPVAQLQREITKFNQNGEPRLRNGNPSEHVLHPLQALMMINADAHAFSLILDKGLHTLPKPCPTGGDLYLDLEGAGNTVDVDSIVLNTFSNKTVKNKINQDLRKQYLKNINIYYALRASAKLDYLYGLCYKQKLSQWLQSHQQQPHSAETTSNYNDGISLDPDSGYLSGKPKTSKSVFFKKVQPDVFALTIQEPVYGPPLADYYHAPLNLDDDNNTATDPDKQRESQAPQIRPRIRSETVFIQVDESQTQQLVDNGILDQSDEVISASSSTRTSPLRILNVSLKSNIVKDGDFELDFKYSDAIFDKANTRTPPKKAKKASKTPQPDPTTAATIPPAPPVELSPTVSSLLHTFLSLAQSSETEVNPDSDSPPPHNHNHNHDQSPKSKPSTASTHLTSETTSHSANLTPEQAQALYKQLENTTITVFHDWWGHSAPQELLAYNEVIDFIAHRKRLHPLMTVYHYAVYETSAIKAGPTKLGSDRGSVVQNFFQMDVPEPQRDNLKILRKLLVPGYLNPEDDMDTTVISKKGELEGCEQIDDELDDFLTSSPPLAATDQLSIQLQQQQLNIHLKTLEKRAKTVTHLFTHLSSFLPTLYRTITDCQAQLDAFEEQYDITELSTPERLDELNGFDAAMLTQHSQLETHLASMKVKYAEFQQSMTELGKEAEEMSKEAQNVILSKTDQMQTTTPSSLQQAIVAMMSLVSKYSQDSQDQDISSPKTSSKITKTAANSFNPAAPGSPTPLPTPASPPPTTTSKTRKKTTSAKKTKAKVEVAAEEVPEPVPTPTTFTPATTTPTEAAPALPKKRGRPSKSTKAASIENQADEQLPPLAEGAKPVKIAKAGRKLKTITSEPEVEQAPEIQIETEVEIEKPTKATKTSKAKKAASLKPSTPSRGFNFPEKPYRSSNDAYPTKSLKHRIREGGANANAVRSKLLFVRDSGDYLFGNGRAEQDDATRSIATHLDHLSSHKVHFKGRFASKILRTLERRVRYSFHPLSQQKLKQLQALEFDSGTLGDDDDDDDDDGSDFDLGQLDSEDDVPPINLGLLKANLELGSFAAFKSVQADDDEEFAQIDLATADKITLKKTVRYRTQQALLAHRNDNPIQGHHFHQPFEQSVMPASLDDFQPHNLLEKAKANISKVYYQRNKVIPRMIRELNHQLAVTDQMIWWTEQEPALAGDTAINTLENALLRSAQHAKVYQHLRFDLHEQLFILNKSYARARDAHHFPMLDSQSEMPNITPQPYIVAPKGTVFPNPETKEFQDISGRIIHSDYHFDGVFHTRKDLDEVELNLHRQHHTCLLERLRYASHRALVLLAQTAIQRHELTLHQAHAQTQLNLTSTPTDSSMFTAQQEAFAQRQRLQLFKSLAVAFLPKDVITQKTKEKAARFGIHESFLLDNITASCNAIRQHFDIENAYFQYDEVARIALEEIFSTYQISQDALIAALEYATPEEQLLCVQRHHLNTAVNRSLQQLQTLVQSPDKLLLSGDLSNLLRTYLSLSTPEQRMEFLYRNNGFYASILIQSPKLLDHIKDNVEKMETIQRSLRSHIDFLQMDRDTSNDILKQFRIAATHSRLATTQSFGSLEGFVQLHRKQSDVLRSELTSIKQISLNPTTLFQQVIGESVESDDKLVSAIATKSGDKADMDTQQSERSSQDAASSTISTPSTHPQQQEQQEQQEQLRKNPYSQIHQRLREKKAQSNALHPHLSGSDLHSHQVQSGVFSRSPSPLVKNGTRQPTAAALFALSQVVYGDDEERPASQQDHDPQQPELTTTPHPDPEPLQELHSAPHLPIPFLPDLFASINDPDTSKPAKKGEKTKKAKAVKSALESSIQTILTTPTASTVLDTQPTTSDVKEPHPSATTTSAVSQPTPITKLTTPICPTLHTTPHHASTQHQIATPTNTEDVSKSIALVEQEFDTETLRLEAEKYALMAAKKEQEEAELDKAYQLEQDALRRQSELQAIEALEQLQQQELQEAQEQMAKLAQLELDEQSKFQSQLQPATRLTPVDGEGSLPTLINAGDGKSVNAEFDPPTAASTDSISDFFAPSQANKVAIDHNTKPFDSSEEELSFSAHTPLENLPPLDDDDVDFPLDEFSAGIIPPASKQRFDDPETSTAHSSDDISFTPPQTATWTESDSAVKDNPLTLDEPTEQVSKLRAAQEPLHVDTRFMDLDDLVDIYAPPMEEEFNPATHFTTGRARKQAEKESKLVSNSLERGSGRISLFDDDGNDNGDDDDDDIIPFKPIPQGPDLASLLFEQRSISSSLPRLQRGSRRKIKGDPTFNPFGDQSDDEVFVFGKKQRKSKPSKQASSTYKQHVEPMYTPPAIFAQSLTFPFHRYSKQNLAKELALFNGERELLNPQLYRANGPYLLHEPARPKRVNSADLIANLLDAHDPWVSDSTKFFLAAPARVIEGKHMFPYHHRYVAERLQTLKAARIADAKARLPASAPKSLRPDSITPATDSDHSQPQLAEPGNAQREDHSQFSFNINNDPHFNSPDFFTPYRADLPYMPRTYHFWNKNFENAHNWYEAAEKPKEAMFDTNFDNFISSMYGNCLDFDMVPFERNTPVEPRTYIARSRAECALQRYLDSLQLLAHKPPVIPKRSNDELSIFELLRAEEAKILAESGGALIPLSAEQMKLHHILNTSNSTTSDSLDFPKLAQLIAEDKHIPPSQRVHHNNQQQQQGSLFAADQHSAIPHKTTKSNSLRNKFQAPILAQLDVLQAKYDSVLTKMGNNMLLKSSFKSLLNDGNNETIPSHTHDTPPQAVTTTPPQPATKVFKSKPFDPEFKTKQKQKKQAAELRAKMYAKMLVLQAAKAEDDAFATEFNHIAHFQRGTRLFGPKSTLPSSLLNTTLEQCQDWLQAQKTLQPIMQRLATAIPEFRSRLDINSPRPTTLSAPNLQFKDQLIRHLISRSAQVIPYVKLRRKELKAQIEQLGAHFITSRKEFLTAQAGFLQQLRDFYSGGFHAILMQPPDHFRAYLPGLSNEALSQCIDGLVRKTTQMDVLCKDIKNQLEQIEIVRQAYPNQPHATSLFSTLPVHTLHKILDILNDSMEQDQHKLDTAYDALYHQLSQPPSPQNTRSLSNSLHTYPPTMLKNLLPPSYKFVPLPDQQQQGSQPPLHAASSIQTAATPSNQSSSSQDLGVEQQTTTPPPTPPEFNINPLPSPQPPLPSKHPSIRRCNATFTPQVAPQVTPLLMGLSINPLGNQLFESRMNLRSAQSSLFRVLKSFYATEHEPYVTQDLAAFSQSLPSTDPTVLVQRVQYLTDLSRTRQKCIVTTQDQIKMIHSTHNVLNDKPKSVKLAFTKLDVNTLQLLLTDLQQQDKQDKLKILLIKQAIPHLFPQTDSDSVTQSLPLSSPQGTQPLSQTAGQTTTYPRFLLDDLLTTFARPDPKQFLQRPALAKRTTLQRKANTPKSNFEQNLFHSALSNRPRNATRLGITQSADDQGSRDKSSRLSRKSTSQKTATFAAPRADSFPANRASYFPDQGGIPFKLPTLNANSYFIKRCYKLLSRKLPFLPNQPINFTSTLTELAQFPAFEPSKRQFNRVPRQIRQTFLTHRPARPRAEVEFSAAIWVKSDLTQLNLPTIEQDDSEAEKAKKLALAHKAVISADKYSSFTPDQQAIAAKAIAALEEKAGVQLKTPTLTKQPFKNNKGDIAARIAAANQAAISSVSAPKSASPSTLPPPPSFSPPPLPTKLRFPATAPLIIKTPKKTAKANFTTDIPEIPPMTSLSQLTSSRPSSRQSSTSKRPFSSRAPSKQQHIPTTSKSTTTTQSKNDPLTTNKRHFAVAKSPAKAKVVEESAKKGIFCDIYPIVRHNLRLSTKSGSLKEVEKLILVPQKQRQLFLSALQYTHSTPNSESNGVAENDSATSLSSLMQLPDLHTRSGDVTHAKDSLVAYYIWRHRLLTLHQYRHVLQLPQIQAAIEADQKLQNGQSTSESTTQSSTPTKFDPITCQAYLDISQEIQIQQITPVHEYVSSSTPNVHENADTIAQTTEQSLNNNINVPDSFKQLPAYHTPTSFYPRDLSPLPPPSPRSLSANHLNAGCIASDDAAVQARKNLHNELVELRDYNRQDCINLMLVTEWFHDLRDQSIELHSKLTKNPHQLDSPQTNIPTIMTKSHHDAVSLESKFKQNVALFDALKHQQALLQGELSKFTTAAAKIASFDTVQATTQVIGESIPDTSTTATNASPLKSTPKPKRGKAKGTKM